MMNKLLTLFTTATASIGIISCATWTQPEAKQIDHIGGYETMDTPESEAYYQSLREWKKTAINYGRPVSFGWFSNWSPTGPIRKGYLSAVPDSMDIISMWSGAPAKADLTEAQQRDKDIARKKKGIKLLEVSLLSHLGKGRTPAEVYEKVNRQAEAEGWSDDKRAHEQKLARWDYWGFTSHELGADDHYAALAKFAKALCESLDENEWDGFDIDWEPGNGFNDMDGTLNNGPTIEFLIKEMGKYIGPKSDPDNKGHKLLCIDGHINSFNPEIGEYVDYWISQSYGHVPSVLSTPDERPEKLIITDNFESSATGGGVLLRQAAVTPKGGVGAYRFDNDYNNFPDYKWMRQAIQINLQSYREWKDKQDR
ncbi:MAG: glycoside hydrolase family 18 [Bacteroidales bacterium]|nr:glycoside hydrolase family 18 [Bacteroidales bacterium]